MREVLGDGHIERSKAKGEVSTLPFYELLCALRAQMLKFFKPQIFDPGRGKRDSVLKSELF